MPSSEAAMKTKISNAYAVVFIDKNSHIIDVSNDAVHFAQFQNKKDVMGQSLAEMLLTDQETIEKIRQELAKQRFIVDIPFQLKDAEKKIIEVLLSGVATYSRDAFSGANLLLRTHVKGAIPFSGMEEYYKTIALFILQKASITLPDFSVALLQYFSQKAEFLLSLIEEYNGKIVLDAVETRLNKVANDKNWAIKFANKEALLETPAKIEGILGFFPLLDAVQNEAVRLNSEAIVLNEVQVFDKNINSVTLSVLDSFDLL